MPSVDSDRIPADPGLQPERTALSWKRTAAGLLLNAVLNLRSAYVNESRPLIWLSIALLGASAAAFVFGHYRHVRLEAGIRSGLAVPRSAVLAVSIAVAIASIAGILSVGFSHDFA